MIWSLCILGKAWETKVNVKIEKKHNYVGVACYANMSYML